MKHVFRTRAAVILGLCLAGCSRGESSAQGRSSDAGVERAAVSLTGAGSSFVKPIFDKWVVAYRDKEGGVGINYQATGSGQGIRAISDRTVDFGVSDAVMGDDAISKAGGGIVHIPLVLGAVAITYNLPGVQSGLRMNSEVLAAIYMGELKSWDDPKIAHLNPDVKLPKTAISVMRRADGSGTTAVFTEYLSKTSPAWKDKVGSGTSVKWPVGVGGNQNAGVAALVGQTPGSIGYVELAYANQSKLPTVSLRNRAGKFISPSADSATKAADSLGAAIPDDLRMSVIDAEGEGAYPVSAFAYLLVRSDSSDSLKGQSMGKFVSWVLTEGQALCAALDYAPLPPNVSGKALAKLRQVRAGGSPMLSSL